MTFEHIGVIGAGAWGTALALTCVRAGREVVLWEHDAANAAHLAKERESLFLPGVRLSEDVAMALAPLVAAGTPLIVCAKGIERGTKKFMNEIIAECVPSAVPAILSGPS